MAQSQLFVVNLANRHGAPGRWVTTSQRQCMHMASTSPQHSANDHSTHAVQNSTAEQPRCSSCSGGCQCQSRRHLAFSQDHPLRHSDPGVGSLPELQAWLVGAVPIQFMSTPPMLAAMQANQDQVSMWVQAATIPPSGSAIGFLVG